MATHLGKIYTVKDVKPEAFVVEFAKYLKRSQKIELPKYVDLVRTGVSKELGPYDADWYYVRAAGVIRRLYVQSGKGVGGLRRVYSEGGRRGSAPEHRALASGAHLRHILQQLEKMGLVEKDPTNGGRRVTQQGRRQLDQVAQQVRRKRK